MKKVFLASALIAMVTTLSGCEGTWRAYGECTSGNQCKAGGEIGGKFKIEKSDPAGTVDSILASGQVFDASQLSIALDGTNVSVPSSGLVTLQLIESSNNTIKAGKVFAWKKVGGNLVLKDPDAVNNWAYTSAGTADTISYDLHPFQVAGTNAANILSVTVKYEGATRASASTTWSAAGSCRVGSCAVQ